MRKSGMEGLSLLGAETAEKMKKKAPLVGAGVGGLVGLVVSFVWPAWHRSHVLQTGIGAAVGAAVGAGVKKAKGW